jgi:hypothetical protein
MVKSVIHHLRIDNETMEKIRILATANYRNINNQIAFMLHAYIKQTKE